MPTKVKLRIEGENRTQQAFSGVSRNLDQMEGKLSRATTVARRFVGVFALAGFARVAGNIIRTDDAASKLARSLGVTTEEISQLQFAAERSGVAQRSLETGIRTLIQATADAQKGNNDYSKTFEALRIDAEKFGRLSLTSKVEALADAFKELGNTDNRQDLAITLFGARGGLGFLNLLEGGSQGLRDLNAELDKLGGTTGTEAGLKAEAAADALTNLQASSTGLARELTGTLLTPLAELVGGLSSIASLTGGVEISFNKMGEGIGKFLGGLGDGQTLQNLKILFGDAEAAAAKMGSLAGSTADVTTANEKAPASIAATTAALKEQTKEATATSTALDSVRDKTSRGAGEGATVDPGNLTAPPTPDGRLVGEEFKEKFEEGVEGTGRLVGDLLEAGVSQGADGALDAFRNMLQQMLVEAAASQLLGLFTSGAGAGSGGGGFFSRLLSFDTGGVVPGPVGAKRLAMVEGGETILPTHRDTFSAGGGSGGIYVDARGAGPGVEVAVERAVAKAVALSEAKRRDSQRRGRG